MFAYTRGYYHHLVYLFLDGSVGMVSTDRDRRKSRVVKFCGKHGAFDFILRDQVVCAINWRGDNNYLKPKSFPLASGEFKVLWIGTHDFGGGLEDDEPEFALSLIHI